MMDLMFLRGFIKINEYKKSLGLGAIIKKDWVEQPNGVLIKPFITEEESKRLDLTYIGLIFPKRTDGHKYLTQTDTIHFVTGGSIEFSRDEYSICCACPFSAGKSIQIPPPIVRKLIPHAEEGGKLEIELIVQPRFNPDDEVHIYD